MSSPQRSPADSLSLADKLLIDEVCNAYEAAWQAKTAPRLEDYLQHVAEPIRPWLLEELLALEIHYKQLVNQVNSADRGPETDRGPQKIGLEATTDFGPAGAGAAAFPPALPGYRLIHELGRGGMGAVFLARDEILDRPVALKLMLPEVAAQPAAVKRFLREARSMAAFKHDHIITIYQVGSVEGVPYLAMEYLKGESLEVFLQRRQKELGGVGVREIVTIARQIAAGLAAAHEGGLIHRDIKPANIWLETCHAHDPDDLGFRAKLLDFGLARPLQTDLQLTKSANPVGTPQYMAPEQARGETVDHRADLFSFGCVLYRACTGKLPFQGPNLYALISAMAVHTPLPIREQNPHIPPTLATLIESMLAKEPVDRPISARAIEATLGAIELAFPKVNPGAKPGHAEKTTPSRLWRRLRVTLLVAMVLSIAGWSLYQLLPTRPASQVPPPAREDNKPPPPKPPAIVADPDRAVAQWVLSIGGWVAVYRGDQGTVLKPGQPLPPEPFTLFTVNLTNASNLTDADLARFDGLENLGYLSLSSRPIGDLGVKNLKLPKLMGLFLEATQITDASVNSLADLQSLRELNVRGTKVTPEGLRRLRERLPQCRVIGN